MPPLGLCSLLHSSPKSQCNLILPTNPPAPTGPDASAVLLEPLGFAAASLVLFAVNNNPDVDAWGGGSHWTLLAYSAADNTFRHYDSMAGTNRAAAAAVFRAVARPGSHLVETATPQQQNGHDCGLYVLALARLLCQRHAAAAAAGGGAELMSFEADGEVNSAGVAALRQELLDLVCRKMAAAAGT